MKTFPPPHNPNHAPETPGYRILGLGDVLNETDDYWVNWVNPGKDGKSYWQTTMNVGKKIALDRETDGSYRRALNIDDPFAPPPDQWTREGYETVCVESGTKAHDGEEWWDKTCRCWIDSVGGTYGIIFDPYYPHYYIRRKVVPAVIAPKVSTPILAHGQSIVVKTHGIEALSRAAQELAFEAGWSWNDYVRKTEIRSFCSHYLVLKVEDEGVRNITYLHYIPDRYSHLFDAKTDLGQLIDLLASLKSPPVPPAPIAPVINGYTAQYTKDSNIVTFGCAQIAVSMLMRASGIMGMPTKYTLKANFAGNREIVSITLDSGVKLGREDIKSVLAYVDSVNAQP